jgi:hypothetical protein
VGVVLGGVVGVVVVCVASRSRFEAIRNSVIDVSSCPALLFPRSSTVLETKKMPEIISGKKKEGEKSPSLLLPLPYQWGCLVGLLSAEHYLKGQEFLPRFSTDHERHHNMIKLIDLIEILSSNIAISPFVPPCHFPRLRLGPKRLHLIWEAAAWPTQRRVAENYHLGDSQWECFIDLSFKC